MPRYLDKYGRSSRSSRKEFVRPHLGRTIVVKAIREGSSGTRLGNFSGNVYLSTEQKDYSYLCTWTISNGRQNRKHETDLEIF